jgi:hypothetical protein
VAASFDCFTYETNEIFLSLIDLLISRLSFSCCFLLLQLLLQMLMFLQSMQLLLISAGRRTTARSNWYAFEEVAPAASDETAAVSSAFRLFLVGIPSRSTHNISTVFGQIDNIVIYETIKL